MVTTTAAGTLIMMVLAMAACTQAQSPDAAVRARAARLDLSGEYSWWSPHASVQGFPYSNDALGMLFSGAWFFRPNAGAQFEA